MLRVSNIPFASNSHRRATPLLGSSPCLNMMRSGFNPLSSPTRLKVLRYPEHRCERVSSRSSVIALQRSYCPSFARSLKPPWMSFMERTKSFKSHVHDVANSSKYNVPSSLLSNNVMKCRGVRRSLERIRTRKADNSESCTSVIGIFGLLYVCVCENTTGMRISSVSHSHLHHHSA